MRRRAAGLVLLASFVLSNQLVRAQTIADLLDGKDAIQCYRVDLSVRCRNLASGQDWEVFTRLDTTVEGWIGSINRDGTKLTCNDGRKVCVIDLDGSHRQIITSHESTNGHFWRDGSGDDWVVYTGELENKDQSGTTWKVRIDPDTNAPVEATRAQLLNQQYSAGMGGSGEYLAEAYGKTYLYNLVTGTKSLHLNGIQNCVGSANPGPQPWMMYERDVAHHDIVISEWNQGNDTARYIWQYGDPGTTIWSSWSSTDPEFCTIEKDEPKALYLVRLQVDTSGTGDNPGSYQEASMGLPNDRIGGVWIGTVTDNPPTVSITSPGDGATVSGQLTVAGTAWDDDAVVSIAYRVDSGSWQGASGTTSWSYVLDTTGLADGNHTVTVRATDSAGQTGTDSIGVVVANTDNPPVVAIEAPADGATLSGSEVFTGTALDDDSIVGVEYRVDTGAWQSASGTTNWSFTLDTTGLSNGAHDITVRATDSAAQTGTDSISFVVANVGTPPSITISFPADGAFVGGAQAFSGTATDDVAVALVEFRLESGPWQPASGTDSWNFTLDTVPLPDRRHTVTVRATDSDGQTSSEAVSVNVLNAGSGNATLNLVVEPGQTATADFSGREYFTTRQEIRGSESLTPVVIGSPEYTPSAGPFEGRWTFTDGSGPVDDGGRFVLTETSSYWSVPLSGDDTARTVTLYGNLWQDADENVDYELSAAGTSRTITQNGAGATLIRAEVTFTGDVHVSLRPLSTLASANFTLCAVATGTDEPQIVRSIEVLTPDGGEIWTAGSAEHITWSTVDVSDVAIHYSTDGGAHWTNILFSVDDQSPDWLDLEWTVPDEPSGNVLVRITDYDDTNLHDESDAPFEIRATDTHGVDGGDEETVLGACGCGARPVRDGPGLLLLALALFLFSRRRSAKPCTQEQ